MNNLHVPAIKGISTQSDICRVSVELGSVLGRGSSAFVADGIILLADGQMGGLKRGVGVLTDSECLNKESGYVHICWFPCLLLDGISYRI